MLFLIHLFSAHSPTNIYFNILLYNKIMSKLISNHKQPVTSFAQLFKNRLSSHSNEQPHQIVSSSFSPQVSGLKEYLGMPLDFYPFSNNQKCVYCQQKYGQLQCQQCNKKRYCRRCFDDTHEGVKFSLHLTRQLRVEKPSNELQKSQKTMMSEKGNKIGENMPLKNSKNIGNSIFQKQTKKQQNNVEENNLKKKVEIYLINLEEKIHKINNRWDIIQQIFKKQLTDIKQVIQDMEKTMAYEINNKRREELTSLYKVFGQHSLRDLKNQIHFTQPPTHSIIVSDNLLSRMKQFCIVYDRWAKNTRKCCQLISSTIQEQFQQAKSFLIKIDIKSMLSKPRQKNEILILQDHNQNLSSKDKSKSRANEKSKISFFNIRNNRNSTKYEFNNGLTSSFIGISPSEINKLQFKKVKSQTTLPSQMMDPHLIKVSKRSKVGQGLTNRPK